MADPKGKPRMAASSNTAMQATPEQILFWFVIRRLVELIFEEGRRPLDLGSQRQWLDNAIACTTQVLLALCSFVTVMVLRSSQAGQISVPVTA